MSFYRPAVRPMSTVERIRRERVKGAGIGVLLGACLGVFLAEVLRSRSGVPPFVVVTFAVLAGSAVYAIKGLCFPEVG